jgi:hypothetical protein
MATAALLFCSVATVSAAVIQNNYYSTDDHPGSPVSNGDLLQTELSSASRTGSPGFGNTYFYREDSGYTVDLSRLTDGSFGNTGGDSDSSIFPNHTTITFAFNLGAHPYGYSLSSIRTYAAWDSGRDGQEYSVEYSNVGTPDTFISLTSITRYNPDFDDDNSTMVQLTSSSGYLAENVAKVRFIFNGFENGGTAFREFDIAGVANVPEPGAYGLVGALALATYGTLSRRQKR